MRCSLVSYQDVQLQTPFLSRDCLCTGETFSEKENFYFTFADVEKAFDRVPWDVVGWALQKLGLGEWLVEILQSMHRNVQSFVGVSSFFRDDFLVQAGLN